MICLVIVDCHEENQRIAFESAEACIRRCICGFKDGNHIQTDSGILEMESHSTLGRFVSTQISKVGLLWRFHEHSNRSSEYSQNDVDWCLVTMTTIDWLFRKTILTLESISFRKGIPSTPSLPFVRRNPSILLTQARVPCTRASVLAMPTTFSCCSREEETPSRRVVRPSLNSIELTPSVGSFEVHFVLRRLAMRAALVLRSSTDGIRCEKRSETSHDDRR